MMSARHHLITIVLSCSLVLSACSQNTLEGQSGESTNTVSQSTENYDVQTTGEDSTDSKDITDTDSVDTLEHAEEERVQTYYCYEASDYYFAQHIDYNSDGTPRANYNTYSENTDVQTIEHMEFDDKSRVLSRTAYKVAQFDSVNGTYRLGDVEQSITFEYSGDAYVAKYYDGDGHLTQEDSIDSYGNIVSRITYFMNGDIDKEYNNDYTYDTNGNVIKSTEKETWDNGIKWECKYTENEYDAESKLIRKRSRLEKYTGSEYDVDNELYYHNYDVDDKTYYYDESGRVSKVDYGSSDQLSNHYEIWYYDAPDAKKPSCVEYYYSDGDIDYTMYYEYDIDGETATYTKEIDSSGDIDYELTVEYEYLSEAIKNSFATES